MGKLLVVVSIAWPMFLAAGWWSSVAGGPPWLTAAVYVSAGRVCHQRPDRSFHTAGAQWPVCGRCAGLYLAGPLGAIAALALRRRTGVPAIAWFIAAAAPTAVTFIIEKTGLAPVSSLTRAVAALPLGAAVAYFIVAVTNRPRESFPTIRQLQDSVSDSGQAETTPEVE